MKLSQLALTVLLSAAVAFATVQYVAPHNGSAAVVKESVYDRVVRTSTIRCGYNLEPPFVVMDPNTKKLSGAGVDIVEEMGKLLGLKIEWTEQVGWDMQSAGLQANRYDMACNGRWVISAETRGAQFTPPLYFTVVHAYGRADETRFDADIKTLNDPAYAVTSMDGEINYYIARDLFPKARRIEYPSMTDNAQLFEAVLTKKADATFAAGFLGSDYIAHNPGVIKRISANPIGQFDTAFMFKMGEAAFAGMLDAAVRQMHAAGTISSILDRYNISPDLALRVKLPIETGTTAVPAFLPASPSPPSSLK